MFKLFNKIFYRIYQWRGGKKDKLDDSFGWVIAGLVVYSILFEVDFLDNFFIYTFFPSYFFYDNIFVALLLVPFVFYIYFTLSNFIIHKFDFLWLKTRGWKISVDTTLIYSFFIVIGFGIGFLSPELQFLGIDFVYIVFIFFFILYYLLRFYLQRLSPKHVHEIYIEDLKKMKDEGKITNEKYQEAIATDRTKDGKGTYIGDRYEYSGEFKEGKFNGQGTLTWANGDMYVGEFKNGTFHGQGTYTYLNGSKYVGEHKDGKMNGQGSATFANGDKYVGEHKDGKMNGQGTYTWVNGDEHVGEWKDDKQNGQGTMKHSDGKIEKGIWENGKLTKNEGSN